MTRVSLSKVLAGLCLAVLPVSGLHAQCFTSSAPTNNCSFGDQINAFTLNSISPSGNSGCGSSGYNSFSSPVWNLNIGSTYSWSATTGSGTYEQGFAIWIDLNNNGIYESTEMVATSAPWYTHSGSLTIPTGSTAGTNIRMRLRCAYYSSISGSDVCTNGIGYGYGETEDYYVNLIQPCTAPTVPTISATATTICNGGSTTLSIATGTLNDATAWQWYSGSCGGTSAGSGTSLTVSPTTTTTYYVRGEGGCVTPGSCASVTITVNDPPTIGTQPAASTTLCEGDALNLSVTASNATGYQWYLGGNPVGTNSSTFSVGTVSSSDAGTYTVEVSGNSPCTAVTSNNAVVTVNAPVVVTTQPAPNSGVCEGSAISLSVVETGATGYQWYYNSNPMTDGGSVSGSSTANLQVNPSVPTDAGTYHVIMTGNSPCPAVTSGNAVVNIITRPTAAISVNGASTVCDGTSTNIEVALTGTGPWNFDINDGTTTNSYSSNTSTFTLPVSPSVTSVYTITALSDATCTAIGADYTGSATVTVNPRPTAMLSVNGSSTICNGDNTSIDIMLTGTAPFDFDYSDGTNTTSETGYANTLYNLPVSPNTTTTYSVTMLQDDNGCVAQPGDISSTATVTVNNPPAIVTPPAAAMECSGTGTSLSVVATGDGLMYQWYYNSNPISDNSTYTGSQSATLTISDVSGAAGSYEVEISGACPPIITSTPVTVTEDFNNTWNGATDQAWSDGSNWSCGTVPIVTTDVLIPNGPTNMPLVDIPNAICNSLSIANAASVMFTGVNNALEIKGNISNNGTFDASNGRVILSGNGTQNIPAITYSRLDIDGGSLKTLDGNATVSSILNLINGFIQLDGYDLTLDVPVQTLGGSASSFIVTNDTGEVIGRNMGVGGNPDAAMFHVGVSQSSYTPIMLENEGTSDHFHVRVMPNVYEDGYGVNPLMVTNPVVDRTWMVDEETAGGSYVNMNPYWNAVNEINGFTQTHVYVAHYLGGMWIGYTTSSNTAPPAGTFGSLFYADADSIQSFSPFTVASSASGYPWALSIKLNNISAINAGSKNRVNWSSAQEDEGDLFELERSADGKNFSYLATMAGKGSNSTYTYWDETPFTGKNFYRLKMKDANGKFSYSNVVSAVVGSDNNFSVHAYPNPVEGGILTVVVKGDAGANASVVITDLTGAVVKTVNTMQHNATDIDVSDLANGVYFVKYNDDSHQQTIKVNKQ